MANYEEMVREFHEAFGLHIGDKPSWPDDEVCNLHRGLIWEEYQEFMDAWIRRDMYGTADGLVDLVYVAIGAAIAYGLPFDKLFREAHRSNMTKLGEDGMPVLRQDGKILKGPNFEPPNIKGILNESSQFEGIIDANRDD